MKNRFHTLNQYFKRKYKERVQKITINAGFSCPNLDGAISNEGCLYCNNLAFNPQLRSNKRGSISEQIEEGMEFAHKRYNANKFMAYYQPYSNTYAPIEELRRKYEVVNEYPQIVALSIGTRPDCVERDKLNLISSFKESKEVWIEYGLQSARDRTLEIINRGHNFKQFEEAVLETKKKDIKICVHLIIGLPGEDLQDYIYTAKEMNRLKIEGVKLHPAHVVKDTKLAHWYRRGEYSPPTFGEYVEAATSMIEYLSLNCIIQRIGASAPDNLLLAPKWINSRKDTPIQINKLLEKKDACQGVKVKE